MFPDSLVVFSYGMLMYELLSLKLPFHQIKKAWDISEAVANGVLPELPPLQAPLTPEYEELLEIYKKCSMMSPSARPKSSRLLTLLRHLKSKLQDPLNVAVSL